MQLALSILLRPAGSGILGQWRSATLWMPESRLAATALLPLLQGADSLDDELVDEELLNAPKQAVKAVVYGVTYLSSLNAVWQQHVPHAGGLPQQIQLVADQASGWLKRLGKLGTWAGVHTMRLLAKTAAIGDLPVYLRNVAPRGPHTMLPVETEEAMPFLRAYPSNAAILGLLKPAKLDASVPYGIPVLPSAVAGRLDAADAIYSMYALGAATSNGRYIMSGGLPTTKNYTPRLSYRGAPSDGQFSRLTIGNHVIQPYLTFTSAASIIKAMRAHEARGNWSWYYEWAIPYNTIALEQMINDFKPSQPVVVPIAPPEPTTLVPKAKPPTEMHPRVYQATALNDWHTTLGSDMSQVMTAHNYLEDNAGKQLSAKLYAQNAQALSNGLLNIEPAILPAMLGDEASVPANLWMAKACLNAAEWETRPQWKQDLVAIAQQHSDLALTSVKTISQIQTDEPDETPLDTAKAKLEEDIAASAAPEDFQTAAAASEDSPEPPQAEQASGSATQLVMHAAAFTAPTTSE